MKYIPLAIAKLLSHRCTITYDVDRTRFNNVEGVERDDAWMARDSSYSSEGYYYLTDEGAKDIQPLLALMDALDYVTVLQVNAPSNILDDKTRYQISLFELNTVLKGRGVP